MTLERKYKYLTRCYFHLVYQICRLASLNDDGHFSSLIHVYSMQLKPMNRVRVNVLCKINEKGRDIDFAKVYSDACRSAMLLQFDRDGIDHFYYYQL